MGTLDDNTDDQTASCMTCLVRKSALLSHPVLQMLFPGTVLISPGCSTETDRLSGWLDLARDT